MLLLGLVCAVGTSSVHSYKKESLEKLAMGLNSVETGLIVSDKLVKLIKEDSKFKKILSKSLVASSIANSELINILDAALEKDLDFHVLFNKVLAVFIGSGLNGVFGWLRFEQFEGKGISDYLGYKIGAAATLIFIEAINGVANKAIRNVIKNKNDDSNCRIVRRGARVLTKGTISFLSGLWALYLLKTICNLLQDIPYSALLKDVSFAVLRSSIDEALGEIVAQGIEEKKFLLN